MLYLPFNDSDGRGEVKGWCHELLVLNATVQTFLLLSVCAEVCGGVYTAWTEQFELFCPCC